MGPGTPSHLTLSGSRSLRTTLLCLLYFAQGFPWGFATVALLSALSEAGHSKEQLATVGGMAILPWTFKFFWAPMIDTIRFPSLGIRRPWIIIAQSGMALTLFGVWSTGDLASETTLMTIAWVFFTHNCFASLQDVATDALAVDLLDEKERGRVNGMMWGSKLFGIALGGAGMGTVIARYNIATAVLIQGCLVVTILVLVIATRERVGEKIFPWSAGEAQQPGDKPVPEGFVGVVRNFWRGVISGVLRFWGVLRELGRALSLRTTALALLLALLVPICEGLYVPLTTDLFVQGFGWTAERFSQVTGTWGVAGELIGALLGGFLCDRLGRRRMAGFGLILTASVLVTFSLTSDYWQQEGYPSLLLPPLFKGCFAFTTVSLFSLYMKISWTGAAATQFTLYMATSNMGHALGAQLNKLNDWISWIFPEAAGISDSGFYLLAGVLALLPLAILPLLDPDSIGRRKQLAPAPGSSSPAD
ncbi:MAG TPA: MFS transporter [Planctomycetes bacterium]|nr:MFS transporter [Planctomycetota bacterium]